MSSKSFAEQLVTNQVDVKMTDPGTCRFCGTSLRYTVVDLGMSPLCESYLSAAQLNQMEAFYPLHIFVCEKCYLVQLQEYVSPEAIFGEYAYFSSYSDSWLRHCSSSAASSSARPGIGVQWNW